MAMQIEFIRKLPSPQELMEQFPIDDRIRSIKAQRDETIRRILTGEDDRFLLIIGPCSADNEDAVVDYAIAWPPCRKKSPTLSSSFPAYTPTSRAPSA